MDINLIKRHAQELRNLKTLIKRQEELQSELPNTWQLNQFIEQLQKRAAELKYILDDQGEEGYDD